MQDKTEVNKDASIQIGGLIGLLPSESQAFYLDLLASSYPVDKGLFHKDILDVMQYEISVIALQSGNELSFENLQHLQLGVTLGVTIDEQDMWRKWISERSESFSALLSARKEQLTEATVNKEEGSLVRAVEKIPITIQTSQAQSDENQKSAQLEVKKESKYTKLLFGIPISAALSLLAMLVAGVIFLSIPSGILPAMFVMWCFAGTIGLSIGVNGFINIVDEGGLTFLNGLLWGTGMTLIGAVIGSILGTFLLPGVGTLSGVAVGALVGTGLGFLFAGVTVSLIDLIVDLLKVDNNVEINEELEQDSETNDYSQMSGLRALKKTPDETVRETEIYTNGSGEIFVNLAYNEKNRGKIDATDTCHASNYDI